MRNNFDHIDLLIFIHYDFCYKSINFDRMPFSRYINETDVGWKPYVESWREKLDPVAQSTFYLLFSNYFEANIDTLRKTFKSLQNTKRDFIFQHMPKEPPVESC